MARLARKPTEERGDQDGPDNAILEQPVGPRPSPVEQIDDEDPLVKSIEQVNQQPVDGQERGVPDRRGGHQADHVQRSRREDDGESRGGGIEGGAGHGDRAQDG